MTTTPYRKQIIKTINKLIKARGKLLGLIISLAFTKEYKHLQDSFGVGDTYTFTLKQFEGSEDVNLQNLVELCKLHEKTIYELIKLNTIDANEIDDY